MSIEGPGKQVAAVGLQSPTVGWAVNRYITKTDK